MKPRSVTCTPHSARPMFSVFTARPAAISTVATSIFCVAPFASTSRVTLSFPVVPDLHLAAGLEHAGALHDRDLVLLHQELDALRVLVAHFAGTLHRDAVVGFDSTRVDAELLRVPHEPRDIGGVEQRLGGNAADVDAYPAELLLLDHRGAHAELGGANGGDVAGGTPAQDDDVKLTGQFPPSPNAECGMGNAEWQWWGRTPSSRFDAGTSIPHSAFRIPHSQEHRQRVLQHLFERLEERRS